MFSIFLIAFSVLGAPITSLVLLISSIFYFFHNLTNGTMMFYCGISFIVSILTFSRCLAVLGASDGMNVPEMIPERTKLFLFFIMVNVMSTIAIYVLNQ